MRNDKGRKRTKRGPRYWAELDEALERYWRTPWLRYRGNLGDGNHRAKLPTMSQQEGVGFWGAWG